MIIQTAPENQPHFAIRQVDHARLSGQLARAFGNAEFAPLRPAEWMVFVAAHHDEGWQETDAACLQDPATGLPFHLTRTPLPELIKTSGRSPAFNESHHPYSGLLSSMHTTGLFNGRYGLSDRVFIDLVPAEHRLAVDAMLAAELERQARLKAQLAADAATTAWVQEENLFHNYKLLQFFDTLALYFHMVHAQARTEAAFPNVPRVVGDDVTITIRPVGERIYQLTPYPFRYPALAVTTDGRFLSPQPAGTDLKTLWQRAQPAQETVTLVGSVARED